jgi:hypothetical protein
MGWFSDEAPGHEGYVVGLVEVGPYRWRELGVDDQVAEAIRWVQVGCECGWRSCRMIAPCRTRWYPSTVEIADEYQDRAAALWRGHVRELVDRRRAGDAEPEQWLVTPKQ